MCLSFPAISQKLISNILYEPSLINQLLTELTVVCKIYTYFRHGIVPYNYVFCRGCALIRNKRKWNKLFPRYLPGDAVSPLILQASVHLSVAHSFSTFNSLIPYSSCLHSRQQSTFRSSNASLFPYTG